MSRIIVKNATLEKELVWRRVVVRKTLDDICHTLELELPPDQRVNVNKHHKIEVRFENPLIQDSAGKRRITTVLVDEVRSAAEDGKRYVSVIGRSPARDIIDSTWSEDFKEMTLKELVNAIGKRFGISCVTFPNDGGDPTQPVYDFRLENESPWQKLFNEADAQGYIFTSNEAGNLYLWKVQSGLREEPFQLVEGVNIKTIEWTENGAEQFHEYVVTGGFADPVKVIDSTCKNNRILTIDIDNPLIAPEKLKRRAETERNRRRENRTTVTVHGWGLTDAQIKSLGAVTEGKEVFWVPNLLIPVKSPTLGLNANLLIAEVEQEAAPPDTFRSTITVVNRSAYL